MINPTQRRSVTTQGQTLETTKYRIEEAAVPHITAMLRNMYSNPSEAVLREYIANAVDAHAEKNILDQSIQIHFPTLMEPWLSVRDLGGGLDIPDTRRLLYGYGASGDLKRTSNEQIGGFGIGCKCGFAIADSFTYTIWHEGRQRVWACFLNDTDEGQAMMTSDDPSLEPAGIEVKIPFPALDSNIIQKAIQQVMPFMPGTFQYNETSYNIPERPDPLVEVKAVCELDGEKYPVTYKFFAPEVLPAISRPAILVGNAVYRIDSEQLARIDYHKNTASFSGGRLSTHRLLRNLVIEVPIGFVQLAPSREELQYSVRTRKVLNELLERFNTESFQEVVRKNAFKQTDSLNMLQRRRTSEMLGLEIDEPQSDNFGFHIQKNACTACWINKVRGMAYGQGYISQGSHLPADEWKAQSRKLYLAAGWFTLDEDQNSVIALDAGKSCTRAEIRELTLLTATKIAQEAPYDIPYEVRIVIFAGLNKEKVKWLQDGSVRLITREDLPEKVEDIHFKRPKVPTRHTSSYRNLRNVVNTKVVQLRDTKRSNHKGEGAWWDTVSATELDARKERKVYVEIDRFVARGPRMVDNLGPVHIWPELLASTVFDWDASLFPELKYLYGIRTTEPNLKEIRQSDQYITLWDYLSEQFTVTFKNKLMNPDTFLRQAALLDIDWESCYRPELSDDAFTKVLRTPELKHKPGVKEMLSWSEMVKDRSQPVTAWLNVMNSMHRLNIRFAGYDTTRFKVGAVLQAEDRKGKQLFKIPGSTNLVRWWNHCPRSKWVSLEGVCDHKESLNIFEKTLGRFCEDFPALAAIYHISSYWFDYQEAKQLTDDQRLVYASGRSVTETLQTLLKQNPKLRKALLASS